MLEVDAMETLAAEEDVVPHVLEGACRNTLTA